MTILEDFIELSVAIGEESANGAITPDPFVSTVIKKALSQGFFGVFKIHDFAKEKPDEEQFCIFVLKNGDIVAGSYSAGLFYNEFNPDGTGTDNIEKWIELDELND